MKEKSKHFVALEGVSRTDIRSPLEYRRRDGVRRGDHDVPLPYQIELAKFEYTMGPSTFVLRRDEPASIVGWLNMSSNKKNIVDNGCLDKLLDQLSVAESLAEDWAERKKTIEHINKRSRDILKLTRMLITRNGRRKLMRRFKRRSSKRFSKEQLMKFPGYYLEYQFAVKPLIGSIRNLVKSLDGNLPTGKVRSRGHVAHVRNKDKLGSDRVGTYFVVHYYAQFGCDWEARLDGFEAGTLARSLGATELVETTVAVLPFSWLVDYFFNVSQLASNFDLKVPDLVIKNQYKTELYKGRGFQWVKVGNENLDYARDLYALSMVRYPGFSFKYQPTFRNLHDLSLSKAANIFGLAGTLLNGYRDRRRGDVSWL